MEPGARWNIEPWVASPPRPAVPLDAALEALALGHPDHVDQLAGGEHLHGDGLAHGVSLDLLRLLQPHLAEDPQRETRWPS